jgi:hypothetical protein
MAYFQDAKARAKRLLRRLAGKSAPKVVDPRFPEWRDLIGRDRAGWDGLLEEGRKGKRILIANSLPGYHSGSVLESVLAAALTLRGAEVHALTCTGTLSDFLVF